MILRRFSRWFLISVCILAFAGFVGTVQLQRAISSSKHRQAEECQAVQDLQQATLAILGALEADPNTSLSVKQAIIENEPIFTHALEASHHC